jgi:hypothetical protein
MREEQHRFLSLLGQPPVRLTAPEVAFVLNCTEEDVTLLMKARLLKPLGQPAQNGTKLFSRRELLALAEDDKWLHKVPHENENRRTKGRRPATRYYQTAMSRGGSLRCS